MFYPVMLNIEDKRVSIVGGGEVAFRKAQGLLKYNARVRVISPEFVEKFKAVEDKVMLIRDSYREELIRESYLVIGATSSKQVNEEIADFCRRNKILCSIADNPRLSDFTVPSSLKRGDLVIAVSTSGKSPALSSKIRRELEEKYTEEYEIYLEVLGEIRSLVLEKCQDIIVRRKILKDIVNLDIEELLRLKEKYEKMNFIG